MKTISQIIARYGDPRINLKAFEDRWMTVLHLPADIHTNILTIPAAIYVNKDIVIPLQNTLRELIAKNVHKEIRTWDGAFVVRSQRGSSVLSMHSLGIALDINAQWNPLYGPVTWSDDFLNIWRSNNWICGADFHTRKDGMHFERSSATSW